MNNVTFRYSTRDDLIQVSKQISESYKASYNGIMSQSYLDSLSHEHWIPILQEAFSRDDVCITAQIDGQIAGTTVYGQSDNNQMMLCGMLSISSPNRSRYRTFALSKIRIKAILD